MGFGTPIISNVTETSFDYAVTFTATSTNNYYYGIRIYYNGAYKTIGRVQLAAGESYNFSQRISGLTAGTEYAVYARALYATSATASLIEGSAVTDTDYVTTDSPPEPEANCHVYADGAWQTATAYVYSGGAWKAAAPHIWNGSAWVPTS